MRIVEAYRVNGRPKQRTLHSLGKIEDLKLFNWEAYQYDDHLSEENKLVFTR